MDGRSGKPLGKPPSSDNLPAPSMKEDVVKLPTPVKVKTPVVLKSKSKRARMNNPSLNNSSSEQPLQVRRSKRTTAGRKLEAILEAEREPFPLATPVLAAHRPVVAATARVTMVDGTSDSVDSESVDCSCGVQEDDHGHMVKCENCSCWSHSSCAGLSVSSAESLPTFLCHKCSACTDQVQSVQNDYSTSIAAQPIAPHVASPNQSLPCNCNSELQQRMLQLEQCHETKYAELLQQLADVEQRAKNDVKVLRLQILSLEEEVQSLKTALATPRPGRPNTTRSTRSNRENRPNRQPPPNVRSNLHDPAINTQQSTQPRHHPTTHFQPPTASDSSSHQSSQYRIVWGTRRSCSAETVRSTISSLVSASIPASPQFIVKKSLRPINSKSKWWFTIISSVEILQTLDTKWHLIQEKTNWVLQRSLRPPRPAVPSVPQPSTPLVCPNPLPIGDPSQNSSSLSTLHIEPQPNSVQTAPTSHPAHRKDNPQQSEPKSVINSLSMPTEPTSHSISPAPLSSPTINLVSMQSQPSAPPPPESVRPPTNVPDSISAHFLRNTPLETSNIAPGVHLQN